MTGDVCNSLMSLLRSEKNASTRACSRFAMFSSCIDAHVPDDVLHMGKEHENAEHHREDYEPEEYEDEFCSYRHGLSIGAVGGAATNK